MRYNTDVRVLNVVAVLIDSIVFKTEKPAMSQPSLDNCGAMMITRQPSVTRWRGIIRLQLREVMSKTLAGSLLVRFQVFPGDRSVCT